MKAIIVLQLLLFCAFTATAQSNYIATNGNIILESSSIEEFNEPDIYCEGTYQRREGVWRVTVRLKIQGGTSADGFVKTIQIDFDDTVIDALSCTGGTTSETIQNCILQAVADYLLVLNPSITFTLN
jgi:hypothetical protein